MHTVLLLLSAAATINAWTAPTKAVHKLRVPPRRDEDRCFYGEVGVDGSVVADVAQPRADTVPPKPPSPELSPRSAQRTLAIVELGILTYCNR